MPIDLEHVRLRRALSGYHRAEVDELLRKCASEIADLLTENQRLRDTTSLLEEQVSRYRLEEQTLRDAIVLAQRAADDTRATAQRHGDVILEEARQAALAERVSAQQRVSELRWEIERLKAERRRTIDDTRAFLERQLREFNDEAAPVVAVIETSPSFEQAEA